MTRDIGVIDTIQNQKNRELESKSMPPLDPEGIRLAEHCRFTFDIVQIPTDPKR